MYRRLSGRRASLVNALGGHLRSKLLLGVLVLIPLAVTFVVLSFIFNGLDGLVQPLVDIIFGKEIVGVGIGMTAAAVYLAGLLASSRLGRAIIRWVEVGILRIPVVSWIYHIVKDITDALSAVGKVSARVVMVRQIIMRRSDISFRMMCRRNCRVRRTSWCRISLVGT